MKSQTFVSVVCLVDKNISSDMPKISEIQSYLDRFYSDYEVILVSNNSDFSSVDIEGWLERVPCIRYIRLSGNRLSHDVMWEAGMENAIGDFVVLFDLQTDPIDIIHKAVDLSKKGTDIVIGKCDSVSTWSYKLFAPVVRRLLTFTGYRLPINASPFLCISRRAANALIETQNQLLTLLSRINKTGYSFSLLEYKSVFPVRLNLCVAFSLLHNELIFNGKMGIHLPVLLGVIFSVFCCLFSLFLFFYQLSSSVVNFGYTLPIVLTMLSILFIIQFIAIWFYGRCLLSLLLKEITKEDYAVVYEKTSAVLINQDRINVLEDSTTDDINLVATGRKD